MPVHSPPSPAAIAQVSCARGAVGSVHKLAWCWPQQYYFQYQIGPHLGDVAALQAAYNTNIFVHKKVPGQWFRADIHCTRLQMTLRAFFVVRATPGEL